MFQSLSHDHTSYADLTFDSWEHGWRSLLLRRFTGHLHVEEAVFPPVAEPLIVLLTQGVKDMESSADGRWQSARFTPGQITLTAPNRPARLRWRTASAEPHQTLHLHIPAATTSRLVEELWDRDPRQVRMPDTLATTDPVLEQTMLGLLRAAEAGVPDLYAESAAEFVMLHALIRHGGLPSPRVPGGSDERVRRARSFLRDNIPRPLSLDEIAAEAGMSRYHFLRVFQNQTGETPHRYLTRLRVERARHELEHGSATVAEVALSCGFASRTHFATAFRRQTGLSPSAYRRLSSR